MKRSRKAVRRKVLRLPTLRFEQQELTSFSGLLLFQALFTRLQLKRRLARCFAATRSAYDGALLVLVLTVHLLLGYRQLRETRYYRHDPMVLRVLGLNGLPDVSTVSRCLADIEPKNLERLRRLLRELVLDRLLALDLNRVTLDFDGSVLSTGRAAEGTAVGFNRKKKGQRSYYPLFCTVAQTGQVFDVLHRPGNVHDSRGAEEFLVECIQALRAVLPRAAIEVRMDSAFFSDSIVRKLDDLRVEFTLSVPFERFVELKAFVEQRQRWHRLDSVLSYFELRWKPKKWNRRYRLVVLRTRRPERNKEPLQLDLFIPIVWGYDFTVVVTNKTTIARKVVRFHHGRGAQEGVFAELKSQGQLDYIPTHTLAGNQTYMLAVILAHNLNRELQMIARPVERGTTERRSPVMSFAQLKTLRRLLVTRAGRFTEPQGRLTLTVSAERAVQEELLHYLNELQPAA